MDLWVHVRALRVYSALGHGRGDSSSDG